MAEEAETNKADAAQIMQFMTTEHFTLQTARSATISDANGRSSLFLSTVSSALVALAFVGQISNMGEAFFVFGLVLLPSLFFIGLVTFVRVLQTGLEDFMYERGISRIRHYYMEIAPQLKDYFILSANDDGAGMLHNLGIVPSRWQLFFTTAGMIGVVNSIIAGAIIGLLLKVLFNLALLPSVIGSIIIFGLGVALHQRYQTIKWQETEKNMKVMFPTKE